VSAVTIGDVIETTDDERVAAAVLVGLPSMTPARLRALFAEWPDPRDALLAIRAHDPHVVTVLRAQVGARSKTDFVALVRRWWSSGSCDAMARLLGTRGTQVHLASDEDFPIEPTVPKRPEVLLVEGANCDALGGPRVAIVGTRAATPHGLRDARELGRFLARAGCAVVSGMAIGIDGAAHLGVLDVDGPAVGVVATGLDVVYPRRHHVLFERVRRQGCLVSESGFGTKPDASRFPVRNRIIAGLADVVVVVEATVKGGARITAERALEYDRPVLAMPGSRRNPAAAGCNALLADGAHPLLDPSDVLVALGMTPGSRRGWERRAQVSGDARRCLDACGGEPATVDQLASRTGLALDAIARGVAECERRGLLERSRGLLWPR
jgi:DNA processing protein